MADNTEKAVKHNQTRILYVEPNDGEGRIDGVPVTPDYTDFCISFDLMVEVVSRMRANTASVTYETTKKGDGSSNTDSGDSSNKEMRTYHLSWTSKHVPDSKEAKEEANYVSFMGGVRHGDLDYLTTYYTDTHYNDFKDKTIVEGLGVESVNISFESYYAPTVKIRFVDVRGASIFGREELLHTDEMLAEDNIWGCFFTFPYPKYKLQVKGFYGKAVTYQLCCTDFRANLNSQNGNYEIDMTFVGYDFGLLADIPMQYLIAAPYCQYADTQAYWNRHKKNDPDWKMSNDGEVLTFKDIKRRIRETIDKFGKEDGENVSTEEIEQTIVDYDRKEVMDEMEVYIDVIQTYLDNISKADETKATIENLDLGEKKDVPVIGKNYETTPIDQGTPKVEYDETAYKNACKELNRLWVEYKTKWPETNLGKLDNITLVPEEVSSTQGSKDKESKLNQTYYIYEARSEEAIKERLIIDFKKFVDAYNADYKTLETRTTATRRLTASDEVRKKRKKIQELVGFIPNIGNVFRTLYCHIETFTHMIYTCAETIYAQIDNNDRLAGKLGLKDIKLTDVDERDTNKGNIPPFPMIHSSTNSNKNKNNTETEASVENDDLMTDSWVGEIKNPEVPWEEKNLIDALFKAVLSVKQELDEGTVTFNLPEFPVIPCDLNNNYIAGVGSSLDDVSSFAGYLAIRAASIFGISGYTDNEAEEVGKMDALNFYTNIDVKEPIKEKVFKALGDGNKADVIYDMTFCKGNYAEANSPKTKNPLKFEKGKDLIGVKPNQKERQPFFTENGNGNLLYTYANNNNMDAFVPSRLDSWDSLNKDILEYDGGETSHYDFKVIDGRSNVLYRRSSEDLIKDYVKRAYGNEFDEYVRKTLYENNEIFTVYYGGEYGDGSVVADKVKEIYEKLKSGSIELNGYVQDSDENRFKTVLKNHWKNITDEEYEATYMGKLQSLYPPMKMLFEDANPPITSTSEEGDGKIDLEKYKGKVINIFRNKNVSMSNGQFKYKDKTLSEDECYAYIPELNVHGLTISPVNVFTSPIYYMQNDYNRVYGSADLSWSNREFANKCMKALLFLMSLNYVADYKPSFLNNKNSGCIENVPLPILLFHGALMWRRKFYNMNHIDPLITSSEQYTKYGKKDAQIDSLKYGAGDVVYEKLSSPVEAELFLNEWNTKGFDYNSNKRDIYYAAKANKEVYDSEHHQVTYKGMILAVMSFHTPITRNEAPAGHGIEYYITRFATRGDIKGLSGIDKELIDVFEHPAIDSYHLLIYPDGKSKDEYMKEILMYNKGEQSYSEEVINKEYKKIGPDEIPIVNLDNGFSRGMLVGNDTRTYQKYSALIGTGDDEMDLSISNRLIEIFEDFVKSDEWETIMDNCELKAKNGENLVFDNFYQLCNGDTGFEKRLQDMCGDRYDTRYMYMFPYPSHDGLGAVLSEKNPALPVIKKLYLSKACVQRTVSQFTNTKGSVTIKDSTYRSYLNGFMKQLEDICESKNMTTVNNAKTEDDNDLDIDIKRLMYMFIKNIWDRWLVGNREELFTTKSYMRNTIFIDSMYRNVYEHIHINCEVLESLLSESDGKSMVFKFLSDITTKHHCMFFAMPDYLELGSPTADVAETALQELFKPLPYSKINNIETSNKFIVMFTHKPSEINETKNSYKYDSFDIYSHDGDKKNILSTFDIPAVKNDGKSFDQMTGKEKHDLQCKRYGYNVPAFGVQFARQNNAIFKRINVGMENPIQTEQAINALSLIAERGRGAGDRTIFYGQDLYNVYSGYSYTATVEMMGNAQIMPLMYFQLFNVPMFRGAYMVYGVTHTMRPGDMTTTIKAMKMSKHTLPWCQEWYAHYYFDNEGNIIGGDDVNDDECVDLADCSVLGNADYHVDATGHAEQVIKGSRLKTLDYTYNDNNKSIIEHELIVAIHPKVRISQTQDKVVTALVNKNLADTFMNIFDCIYRGVDKDGKDAKINGKYFEFDVNNEGKLVAYAYRKINNPNKPGSSTLSNHSFGVAVDINPGKNPFSCTNALKKSQVDTEKCIRTKDHPVVRIFRQFGFGWGGRYQDFMHFSYFDGK